MALRSILRLFAVCLYTTFLCAPTEMGCDVHTGTQMASLLQKKLAGRGSGRHSHHHRVTGNHQSACPQQQPLLMHEVEGFLNTQSRQSQTDNISFVHIPGNAGEFVESVGSTFGFKWGVHATTAEVKLSANHTETCPWHRIPPQLFKGLKLYQNRSMFCVTQHPIDRMLSTYLSIVEILQQSKNCGISQENVDLLRRYPLCSKRSLNHFTVQALARVAKNKFDFNCRLIPQSAYIWDEEYHEICRVRIRFEELPQRLAQLISENALVKDLKILPSLLQMHVNSTGTHQHHLGSICPGLTIASFNERSMRALLDFYSWDFQRLAYF